jgi:hypothetical protein
MTVDHTTEAPAAAGTRILLETTLATLALHRHQGTAQHRRVRVSCGGPVSVGELAKRCGADTETLRRVLRCVAATGLLRSAGPQRYELTEACQAVLGGWAFGGFAFNADPEMWNALGEITETLRGGAAPLIGRHAGLYGYLATRPATAAGFDAMMTGNHAQVADALAVDFPGLGTVVDVGGGHGGFIAAILRKHPTVRGILADLHQSLPGARDQLAAAGVADRCTVVACDFFTDPVPEGAEVYLLAHVIHNWNDEQALAILRGVRAAMPAEGRLLLVEAMIPEGDEPHLAKDLDIRIITMLPGGGRTESEYARLLDEAGFQPRPAVHLARIESVIAATPAG